MSDKTCKTCEWWGACAGDRTIGTCAVFPEWRPMIKATHWCGQWKDRPLLNEDGAVDNLDAALNIIHRARRSGSREVKLFSVTAYSDGEPISREEIEKSDPFAKRVKIIKLLEECRYAVRTDLSRAAGPSGSTQTTLTVYVDPRNDTAN